MTPLACAAIAAACQIDQIPPIYVLVRPPPRWSTLSVRHELYDLEQRLLRCEEELRAAARRKVR